MSYQGVEVSTEGQQHVPSAVGPMTRSLSSLTTVTKSMIEAELWELDPQLPPLSWKSDVFQELSDRPLVVGTMLDDGVVKVHPPVERVFNETVAKLQSAGHEIVPWDSSLNADCIAIMVSSPSIAPESRLTSSRTHTTPPMAVRTYVEQSQKVANHSSHTCRP